MTAKLAKIVLSIIVGMLGLVLVMSMLAGVGPVAAMKDVEEDGGGALVAGVPDTVTVETSAPEIRAEVDSTATITGTVEDQLNQPVGDAFIAFTTSLGTIDQYCYVEAEADAVIKSAGWYADSLASASGGQYVEASGTVSPDATLSWTFTATAISLLYVSDLSTGGVAEVQVDGRAPVTVAMCSGTMMAAERVIATGLTFGPHTITVTQFSSPPECPGGPWIRIDAFRCGATTDANGQATATLTSTVLSCGSENATVTALTGDLSFPYLITGTESVQFTASVPNGVTVTADPNQIAADGVSTSILEAAVLDQFGENAPDYTMVGFVATDENGAPSSGAWVTLPYELVEGEDPTEVITSGSWSTGTNPLYHDTEVISSTTAGATASWAFTGTAVSLMYAKLADAGVASVTVDSGSPITIDMYASSDQFQVEHVITDTLIFGPHVIMVTVGGYTVAGGTDTRVYLDAFRSGTGTSDGAAAAGLTSGTQAGVVWVEATGVGRQCCETDSVVADTVPITLTAGDPYTLTITPADVPITCCITSTLQFTVTDQYSNVVGAVVPMTLTVIFTSTPYGDFTPPSVEITNGVGSVEFHGYEAGSGAITGTVGDVTGTSNLTVTASSCDDLVINADRAWIYVTDTNISLLPGFIYTSTITADMRDSCNNPVDGTVVTFTTSLGNLSTVTQTTISGVATATLTSVQLVGVPTQTAYITVTGASCPVSGTTSVDFVRHVYTLTVTADPDEMRVGGETSDLTADVYDGSGEPTPDGVTVGFTITNAAMATVLPTEAGTEGGMATAAATSVTQTGVATIETAVIVTGGTTISNTGLITITAGDPYTLTMTLTDDSITCCVTSTLTFTVTDVYSNVVGAVVSRPLTVSFTSTPYGIFTPTNPVVITDGVGNVEFHGWTEGIGTITGTVQGYSVTGTSNLTVAAGEPVTLTVTRAPAIIQANDTDTAIITATVQDACENLLCSRVVTFTTDIGSFETPTETLRITRTTSCPGGVATATLRSWETKSGRATIVVTVEDTLTKTTYVDIVGSVFNVELEASLTSIEVGGYTSTLTATVEDVLGNPVGDGTVVTFTTSLGILGSTTVAKPTTGGVATAVLTSGTTAGTAVITATSASADPATTTVTIEAGSPATMTLEADPESISVGGFTSTLTVTVTDQYNNPVGPTEVTFTTTLGSLGSDTITKTTADGVATAVLTSTETEVGTAFITATTGSGAGMVTGATTVTFTAGSAHTVTLEANPTSLTVDETSALTATVRDEHGYLVEPTVVTFTTSLGNLSSDTVTTTNGIATATLTSQEDGTATVTATIGMTSAVKTVVFSVGSPAAVTLVADPPGLTAGSASTLSATVTDQYNNSVADGTVVTFTTSLGDVGSQLVTKTTTSGVAIATLTSQVAGTAVVTATADSKYDTTNVTFQPDLPYTLTLAAYPTALTVGDTSTLTATVKDQYDNNVADGTSVLFETNLGSLGSLAVTKTTASGIAVATLTSQVPGTATVVATADPVSDTVDVTFEAGPAYTVTLEAYPMTLTVGSSSALTATVTDQYNNSVTDGTVVTFTTSLGDVGSQLVTKTTTSGVAIATLTSQVAGTAAVTATADSKYDTTNVTFQPDLPYTLTLVAYPTDLTVVDTSTLSATVKDQYDNNVADGTVVTFTTSLGEVGSESVTKTTTSGVAIAELSSQVPGTATITATADPVSDTVDVTFEVGPPYTMTLVAYPISLTVGATSTLTVTVSDQFNNNVADGTVVNFETNLGSLGSTTVSKTTVSGVATATLTSQVAGTAVVTATSDSKYGTANVTFNPDLPYTMTVEAYPTSIPIGGFTSEITATVKDQYDNLVADGTEVTLITDLGSIGSNSVVKTTVSGVANATLTSDLIIGTANITATSGSAEGQTQVIFTVGAPYTITVESWPPTIEVGGSTATITATVTDIGSYPVADGTPVVFTTDFASLGSSTATKYTTDGVAVATLTSGTTPGVAHITATADSKFDTATVEVAAGPPFSIDVTADPTYIPIGGATSLITATVKDRYDNNVTNGTNVDFITILGSVSPSSDATDEGTAVTTLTSGIIKGPATVTAIAGPEDGSVDVVFTVGPPSYVDVVADTTSIGLNGQTSNIQATVKDVGDNPVADGTEVTFATSLGLLGSDTVIKTTTGGVAEAVLTSETTAGTAVITATADSHYHTTEVVFSPDPPDAVEVTADPMAIPANGTSTSLVRATVTDQYSNMVADGITCYFNTTLGGVWPPFDTTLNGVAETTLTSSETIGLAAVTATCEDIPDMIYVSFYVPVFKVYLPTIFKAY